MLKERYQKEIIPKLQAEFGYKNIMQAPKVSVVVVHVGVGKMSKDQKNVDAAVKTLTRICGQKPTETKARKSISNFKVREGQVVGLKCTLRGKRMYDFLEKLVHVTFPRVRDFRGLSPKIMDAGGNFSLGFTEHLAFPEIRPDEVEAVHGVQVTVRTTARNSAEGLALAKALGFPFQQTTNNK
ncbi:MAG: 50S ribosomal protein L5 [Candidatus Magasanikbacteria bacterium]|nr:50S ribosomal protein L5 [Candidatus Magasanikbacteria bacterium]